MVELVESLPTGRDPNIVSRAIARLIAKSFVLCPVILDLASLSACQTPRRRRKVPVDVCPPHRPLEHGTAKDHQCDDKRNGKPDEPCDTRHQEGYQNQTFPKTVVFWTHGTDSPVPDSSAARTKIVRTPCLVSLRTIMDRHGIAHLLATKEEGLET